MSKSNFDAEGLEKINSPTNLAIKIQLINLPQNLRICKNFRQSCCRCCWCCCCYCCCCGCCCCYRCYFLWQWPHLGKFYRRSKIVKFNRNFFSAKKNRCRKTVKMLTDWNLCVFDFYADAHTKVFVQSDDQMGPYCPLIAWQGLIRQWLTSNSPAPITFKGLRTQPDATN